MGVLKFPMQNMCWKERTRISIIEDAMARNLFQVMRAHLKLVDDITVTPAKKKESKLWKLEPLLLSIRQRCMELGRTLSVAVDEMILPLKVVLT